MTGALSWWHWAILIVVVIVLFGANRLPGAARSLGQSLRIFKSEVREMQTEGKPQPSAAIETPTPAQSQRVDPPSAQQQDHPEARPA